MRLVVDSSVIVGACLAGGVLGPLVGHDLHAPALLPSGVASVLREMAHREEVPADRAREALASLARLAITYAPPASLAESAFQLATELGWAKTYDAEYVVLAQMTHAPLVTLDARLRRGAGHLATILGPTDL